LIFEIEDLRNELPGFVRSTLALEQLGHGCLPPSIDLGPRHLFLCGSQIIRLRVTDEQTVIAEEERIVAPAGIA